MEPKRIIALGFFDGVHLGHQALLSACRRLADGKKARAAALTFESHPDELVLGASPALINTPHDRRLLLERFGMDEVIALPFDDRVRNTSWQDFFEMLRSQYGAVGLVCGEDFRFGAGGRGTAQLLREACKTNAMDCCVVPEQTADGEVISSTRIRRLIVAGEMEKAVALLGHPHILTGEVISGRHLGRTIGVPTANLAVPQAMAVPAFGVYACRICVRGQEYMAVTNVGTRPTVGGHRITVEPWILDFDGDIYGLYAELQFFAYLRPERKFDSLDELKQEIQRNAQQTRKFFGKR